MAAYWYALRSKPRKEDILWQQVGVRGFECFYPRLRVKPVNPKSRKVRPYFPGYMFVRADLSETGHSPFQYLPYSGGLVCFGGEPARVPEAMIHAIRRRLELIIEAGGELFAGLKPGDRVWIQDGPFAGYEAIFDARLSGREHVRVLLQMLGGRSLRVELSAAQLERQRRI